MKKTRFKTGTVAGAGAILLFFVISLLALSSIQKLQGNARVVNYVGIVRGATQKLVKEELMGFPDDELIARLDAIVDELCTGRGAEGLVALDDDTYRENMRRVRERWDELKDMIARVREGASPMTLYEASQEYFELVNETAFSAERYAEAQVNRTKNLLLGVNACFLLAAAAAANTMKIRKRADALGKIAYIDPLTHIRNRASCDRLIARLDAHPPQDDVAVIVFDMNNLKSTNDALGHQSGDRSIVKFARILKAQAKGFGFVGRFGGDEFLAVFEHGTRETAEKYIGHVRRRVKEYNAMRPNTLEQIHFAAGCAVGNVRQRGMEDLIHEADSLMYSDKRRSKMRI